MRPLTISLLLALPLSLAAQEPVPAERALSTFAAQRVAVTPVQAWRADSLGWSANAPGDSLRAALDSAIAREFRERGMASRWAYAADVMRSARRNPTLRADPAMLGIGRWRGMPPKAGDPVPQVVADNLRTVSALGDTRYALIPVELRGAGDDAVLRVVIADTRRRIVVWTADLIAAGSPDATAAVARRLADLVVDP